MDRFTMWRFGVRITAPTAWSDDRAEALLGELEELSFDIEDLIQERISSISDELEVEAIE